jgi:hypothetical protein
LHVCRALHLLLENGNAGARTPVHRKRENLLELLASGAVVASQAYQPVISNQIDADQGARKKPLAALRYLVEDGSRVRDRTADHAEHFGRGLLLIERFLRLVEEPHVLDRDRRLVGERPQQGDLLLGERPHVHPAQRDRAEGLALAHQGHG